MSELRRTTIQLTIKYSLVFFAFIWLFSGGVYLWVNSSLGEGYIDRINSALEQQHSTATHQAELADSTATVAADIALDRLRNILLVVNIATLFGIPIAAYLISRRTLIPLVESQKSQQRFVANASHELRTPLAVMLADLDWALKKERTVGDYKNTLTSTRQEVEEMSMLVRSLLLLTRLNDQKLRFTTVDLAHTLRQAIAEHQALADEKGITIQAKMANLNVSGNGDLLAVVCNNLLENATKYASQRSTINIAGETTDGGMIRVSISNHTDELSQNNVPHLFDRFYQAEAHQAGKGSGLGLAIVKQIVDAHDGKVEATLNDGVVTFSLILRQK